MASTKWAFFCLLAQAARKVLVSPELYFLQIFKMSIGGIFLLPKELDVVSLTDGREVTVLEVYGGGTDFYVEYQCPDKDDCDWFMVEKSQIKKIIWTAAK